jgi:sugar diacid utilization regulator
MSGETAPDQRDELSAFRPLLALSMVMNGTADEDEILRLATSAVAALGPFRTEAVHLDGRWRSDQGVGAPAPSDDVQAQLAGLDRAGGPIELPGTAWTWGYPLASLEVTDGYVMVSASRQPEQYQEFLVGVLMQQTAAALANARLHANERAAADRLAELNLALERVAAQAERSAAAANVSLAVHDRLTRVAVEGEGPDGLAQAVHELTGRPVVIEDRYGNVVSSAGPEGGEPTVKDSPTDRERLLARLRVAGGPLLDRDRLVVLARGYDQDEGVIALSETDGSDGDGDIVVLEHAATVLALELAHRRSIAETELRLRRDLVEELLGGTDAESARERARALGYDLDRPHRVVVIVGRTRDDDPHALFRAVRNAARHHDVGSLLVARAGGVALLSDDGRDLDRFRATVIDELGPGGSCRVGISGLCLQPDDFPRAFGQAQLALKMQAATNSPEQVTAFDDLGVYKLLSEVADISSVEAFIRHWLGTILDHDANKGGQLIVTLTGYLECGGNYDATADRLSMHRSTVRYRLGRLREVSGYDLTDPETRFNLQLATRALVTLNALRSS